MSQYGGQQGHGGGRGGYGGGQYGQAPEQSLTDIWPNYLKEGYFDADQNLRAEYVSRETVEKLVQAMCGARVGLTTHQVRRYFGHCRAVETQLRSSNVEWKRVWPLVAKLGISAADGASKQPTPKIPKLFQELIQRNVDKLTSKEDFLRGFLPHFEAIIGFGQAHFKKDRN